MSSSSDDLQSIKSDIYRGEKAGRSESRNSKSQRELSRNMTRELMDEYLEKDAGVRKVVSKLDSRVGELGPIEVPIDMERVPTKPDPNSDFNETDPWQYPIDSETGLRIVDFVDGDKANPKNRLTAVKWGWTLLLGFTCFVVAVGSAIVTGDMERPAKYFRVSQEVVILASVTCFVLGFGFGPLIFAPMSEEFGRQYMYWVSLGLGIIFIIPCGLAHNITTLIMGRLLDGLAYSAPMCLIGGSLADIWEAEKRGVAMAIFSAAPFLGPVMGPIFGGLLCDNAPTWRWIYWTFMIISGFNTVLIVLLVPETYAPTILKRRAKKLRKMTGDDRYRTFRELEVRTIKKIAHDSFLRPFMLLSEPIVMLISVYMAVCYGLLYMFFFAYPVIYQEYKHFSASLTGVMFIPIGVGVIICTAIAPVFNWQYNKLAQPYRDRGEIPPPEYRLIPMLIGCWFLPVSLFPFAWSSYPRLSWAGPCFSGFGVGCGFALLYNPANNYIVDSYQHYAASGLAAKTLVRSLWGACCPLFTIQMYHTLGLEWASSLMAFISLACCLIPFCFYKWGAVIRQKSKYAYSG